MLLGLQMLKPAGAERDVAMKGDMTSSLDITARTWLTSDVNPFRRNINLTTRN